MIASTESTWPPELVAEMLEALSNSNTGRTILRRGRLEGLGPVEHLYARRLGRPIADAERAELLRRLDTLGADRIGDVVFDLAPDALAAWLADPAAT